METDTDADIDNELTVDTFGEPRICLNDCLPPEIVTMVFKYLDCTSLTKAAMTNKFWYKLFTSKEIQKSFKIECMELFNKNGLYSASKKYLETFHDWKHMFIYRPRVRSDGVYFARVNYWHDGLTEFGAYNPLHMVTYYVLLQFSPKGRIVYAQSHFEPEKFLEKISKKKVPFDNGVYYVKNNTLNIEIHRGKYTYCHSYKFLGRMYEHSDSFVLESKHIINVESQTFTPIKEKHGKTVLEFTK